MGSLYTVSALSASYSLASVSGTSNVGGLVGSAGAATTSITASYAYGAVTRTSGTATTVGGLLGHAAAGATITDSYYDSEAGGVGGAGGGGVAKTRRALQEPTAYGATTATPPSIYANWNLDVDETTGADDPWAFGNADQFPVLKAHGQDTAAQFRLQPALSGVASLTALSIPGVTLAPAFANGTEKTYTGTLTDASVGYLTVSGTTSVSVADVVITPADARASEAGHQVQLNAGSNAITVTVRAQNCTPQSCTQDGPYTITVALTAQDYDDNENGLIDIRNLAQLNAIRWDLDGNGVADASANNDDYAAAFGRPQPGMGCPESDHDDNSGTPDEPVCTGYELRANLDFDTGAAGDRTDDAYYNGGAGWTPIGGVVTTGHPFSYDTIFANSISPTAYSGRFNGNGHTISNLSIVRTSEDALGLFGAISGHIEQVGLVNPSVVTTTGAALGPLVGYAKSTARVTASYAQGGEVRGGGYAGGLVGYNKGAITVSYADVAVRVVTPPPGQRAAQPALRAVGGLVGANTGTITYSYAIGKPVNDANSPVHNAGGLLGLHDNTLGGRVANSYWDTIRTGRATSAGLPASAGLKTYQLRAPTDYGATSADLYYGWNLDLNNDGRLRRPLEIRHCHPVSGLAVQGATARAAARRPSWPASPPSARPTPSPPCPSRRPRPPRRP